MSNFGIAESDTVWVKKIGSEVKAVKFSPDGQFIYAAAYNHKPMKIETNTGNVIKEFDGFIFNYKELTKYSMDLSADGRQLYAGGIGSCLYIWDTESGILLDSVCTDYAKKDVFPYFKSISVNGEYLAALVADGDTGYGIIHIWNRKTKEELKVFQVDRSNRIEFDPTGRFLAVYKLLGGSELTGTVLIETSNWSTYFDFVGHTSTVRDISFSPDGSLLASCGWDGIIKIWDVEQKNMVSEIKDEFYGYSVGFIDNNKIIYGGGFFDQKFMKIFDIQSNILGKLKIDHPVDMNINNSKHFCVVANSDYILLFDYLKVITGIGLTETNVKELIKPNPTNNISEINFFLPFSGKTFISINDANSSVIEILFNGFLDQGQQKFQWIPKGVPSGIYFCNITAKNFSKTLKIILEK